MNQRLFEPDACLSGQGIHSLGGPAAKTPRGPLDAIGGKRYTEKAVSSLQSPVSSLQSPVSSFN